MKFNNLKKSDFFLSGAVETGVMFYYFPTVGAAASVNETAIIINEDGVSRFYLGKSGVTKAKEEWLKMPTAKLRKKFSTWRKKWWKYEKEFYNIAANKSLDWKVAWKKTDKIGERYWLDSYKVEAIDSFADEIEAEILKGFRLCSIDENNLHELITPAEPTLLQKIIRDGKEALRSKSKMTLYLRKYWYIKGSWAGGEMLKDSDVAFDSHITMTDFKKRKKLHRKIDKKMDPKTLRIVELLRLQFIWREERKAFLQMMNIAMWNIAKQISKETGIDPKMTTWLNQGEVALYQRNPGKFASRPKQSVFYVKAGSKKGIILDIKTSKTIFQEFINVEQQKELKGTVASKGKIQGIVRLILKEHQFHRFNIGEVLVTTMTRPEFVPLMTKASAIVTDEGGLTSHAAIVSRELKKPCVVGTKHATQVFQDGDRVEVDAEKGIVKILR